MKRISKIIFLLILPIMILFGCVSLKPEIISLRYKDADYTLTPLYEFNEGEMQVLYEKDGIVYGQIYDMTKNNIFFNTIDLFGYNLTTNELKWMNYQNFVRIMDFMSDEHNIYYYEYYGTDEDFMTTFYRFVDGKNDKKLYEESCSDLFNSPEFRKYKSSFILISSNENGKGMNIRIPNKEGNLEKIYTYDHLNRCITATPVIEGDYLYVESINEENKSLYRINLIDGQCDLIIEKAFDRFTVTSSYIVLYEENKEMVFNHDGKLLKEYEYETIYKTTRWVSKLKNDEVIVTDFYNNMYYRNLNDDICYKLSADDPVVGHIPVRFITTEDSVIAQSRETLYQIYIKK